MTTSSLFWLKNPLVLFDKNEITHIWPQTDMTLEQKINAITRLVILLSLLGTLLTRTMKYIFTGSVTLVVLVILYFTQQKKNEQEKAKKNTKKILKEGFENINTHSSSDFTQPTKKNPLMNVLMPEYKYNPKRKEAAPCFNPKVEKKINEVTKEMISENQGEDKIDSRLFRDLTDNLSFEQSMRSFNSTPNTRIPNDQTAFAEYCYGNMISCSFFFCCVKYKITKTTKVTLPVNIYFIVLVNNVPNKDNKITNLVIAFIFCSKVISVCGQICVISFLSNNTKGFFNQNKLDVVICIYIYICFIILIIRFFLFFLATFFLFFYLRFFYLF